MQLRTVLSALAAVLASTAAIAAAPVADTNDFDTNSEDLNDITSKIIVVPGSGYPRPRPSYYPGGRDPTIIVIHPYDPYGPFGSALARRPGKRADNDKTPKILLFSKPTYPAVNPIGHIRPLPKRTEDVDEDSKILLIKPGAGLRPHYPPIIYLGYPSFSYQGYSIGGLMPPYLERADIDAAADADFDAFESENENEDVNYSKVYPSNPYWDPRRPHIMR